MINVYTLIKGGDFMTINRNGFIDMGNGLFINMDKVVGIDNNNKRIRTREGDTYEYNEFPTLYSPILREECYESNKGDFLFFKKGGKK